jgi:hypothetical protein
MPFPIRNIGNISGKREKKYKLPIKPLNFAKNAGLGIAGFILSPQNVIKQKYIINLPTSVKTDVPN